MIGRHRNLIGRWSAAWRWVERAAAWDAEQDRLLRLSQAHARRAFAKRLAAEGAVIQARGLAKIRSYVDRVDGEGRMPELQPGQRFIDEMPLRDAIRLIETGARLESLGRSISGTTSDDAQGMAAPVIASSGGEFAITTEVRALMRQLADILDVQAPTQRLQECDESGTRTRWNKARHVSQAPGELQHSGWRTRPRRPVHGRTGGHTIATAKPSRQFRRPSKPMAVTQDVPRPNVTINLMR
jgi:hypothetical protein